MTSSELKKNRLSKLIFGGLIVLTFGLIFGPSVYAGFLRFAEDAQFKWGYGHTISPLAAAGYGSGYGYGIIANASNYGFSGADGKATGVAATYGGMSGFTVSFSTNYLGKSRIEYGLTDSYGSATAYSSYKTGIQFIEVSGLNCGQTYHYRVDTKDAGNVVWPTANATTYTTCGGGGGNSGGGSGGGTTTPPPAATTTTATTTVTTGSSVAELEAVIASLQAELNRLTLAKGGKVAKKTVKMVSKAVAGNAGAIKVTLRQGSRGNDVKLLQAYLIAKAKGNAAAKLAKSGATGSFGLSTKAALVEFQKSVGIKPANGIFGPMTRAFVKNNP